MSILGFGFVGAILKKYYPEAKVYDIKGDCDPLEEVLAAKIIFVAINLKDNAHSEESLNVLREYIKQVKEEKIWIIKSTLKIGVADLLQNEFPEQIIIYNPEFLTETTAWEDFTRPTFQILGISYRGYKYVDELFSILPDAPVKRVISLRDAETLKHAKNSFYALKVIWFNQLYDSCVKLNSDYETIREILTKDPWIGDSHSIIWHRGYRGYGDENTSKCLPKDLTSFLKSTNMELLKTISKLNDDYIKQKRDS